MLPFEPRKECRSPKDGQTFYTRDGAFMIDNNKQLVTSQGLLVLDGQGKKIVIELPLEK